MFDIVKKIGGINLQKYTYKAIDADGKVTKGTLVAADDKNFRDLLHEQGLRCYDYSIVNQAKQARTRPLKTGDLIAFSSQLASMLRAGLDLSMSMKMLYERTEKKKKRLRAVLASLFEQLQKGESLASAMAKMENTFPAMYISMVKSGEMNGKIDESLTTLASYFEKEQKQKNQIKGAMSYPIILLVVCFLVVIVMSVFVMPQMTAMMPEGTPMPLPTQVLMGIKDFIVNQWYVVALIVLVLITIIPIIKRIPQVAVFTGKMIIKIPKIGSLQKMIYTATFARSLATLYATGIPLLDAISMGAEIITNKYVEMRIREAVVEIRKGSSIAEAFAHVDAFDPMLMTMTFVGEQSGALDEILMQTARYFDEESSNAIKRLIGMISPAMMMIMAVVVGFVLMGVMMPMFTLYETIG